MNNKKKLIKAVCIVIAAWILFLISTCANPFWPERSAGNHACSHIWEIAHIIPSRCTIEGEMTLLTCTICSEVKKETAQGHDGTINWSTYNSSNGHVYCDQIGCVGRFATIGETGPAGGPIYYVAPLGFNVAGYPGVFSEYTAFYLEGSLCVGTTQRTWSLDGVLENDVTTSENPFDSKMYLIGNGRRDTHLLFERYKDYNYFYGYSGILGNGEYHFYYTGASPGAYHFTSGSLIVHECDFNDWFLPSIGELREMYKAKGRINNYFFIGNYQVWSSTQRDEYNAWSFSGGYASAAFKSPGSYIGVFAVRAF